jgi:alpha-L-rhamnosidase
MKNKSVIDSGQKLFLIFIFVLSSHYLTAQRPDINPGLLKNYWDAEWITCAGVPARAYGVYHFRKTFSLNEVPKHFLIHVTADNRYRLFINGKAVGRGPARGDLYNWNFETYDIAPYIHDGENLIAALVWNMGEYAPVAQVSNQTGFLLQADDANQKIVNTNSSWKVFRDAAYNPCALNVGASLHTYMVIGPGDELQADSYPWGWEQLSYDEKNWKNAEPVNAAAVPFGYGSDNVWTLTHRTIPQMEETPERLNSIRRSENIMIKDTFITGHHPLLIPGNTSVSVLLDQSYETTAYPELIVSKGKDAIIKMTYAEALLDSNGKKGNRDDIAGRTIKGLFDIFHVDGGNQRTFTPLWFRTYRYVQIDVQTKNEPLSIDDFYGHYTGYPFQQKATFVSNDSSLRQIWNVGWRTARLCAGETYFDCPYYEQLQYEADTRIQSLISLYNSGDDRLMRKAIHDFYNSRVPSGLTQGRYPSNRLQVIPPFSLFWISMLHDYWMLRDDTSFIKNYLNATTLIIDWYEQHIDPKKEMLGPMDWWNFTDWNNAFPGGTPPGATDGNSSVITLQFVYTLQQAADLFNYFGQKELSKKYKQLADQLSAGVYKNCFDKTKMEMANTPEKNSFSQHASIWAVLTDAVPTAQQKQVMGNVLNDTSLSQATFYFRFYLTRAMIKAGMGDLYYSQLTPWRNMLKIGLTTFAENPEPTRSDCHGWSASPEYDFLATICGITSSSPGFQSVKIEPHLGDLQHIKASMPYRDGEQEIKVELQRKGKSGIKAEVDLPANLSGEFIWQGTSVKLHPGNQEVNL